MLNKAGFSYVKAKVAKIVLFSSMLNRPENSFQLTLQVLAMRMKW